MAENTVQLDHYEGGCGIVKAVTGAGKSLVAKEIAEGMTGKILVLSHSRTILNQWRLIFDDNEGCIEVDYNTFQQQCKVKYDGKVHLLIIDEVHRSTSEEYIKIYDNVNYYNILGLSATPTKESIEKCGDIFVEVGLDEANICPFYVHFHGIELSPQENFEYRKLSRLMSKFFNDEDYNPTNVSLEDIIFKRRGIVYEAKNRMPTAIELIRMERKAGRKIVVFCQRKAQANDISNQLACDNIGHVLYHSDTYSKSNDDELEQYKNGTVKILVSVGMVKEGFDDPDTDCGIIVSTPLTETFHIQTIGRIIRFKPDKRAIIHIILANGTSDLKVIKHSGNYDFELDNIKLPVKSVHKHDYYQGTKYSFRDKLLWQKQGNGFNSSRLYFKYHPILEVLRKHKRQGGSFVITNKGVYMKIGEEIIKVSDEVVELEIDETKKPTDWSKPLSEEDKEEMYDFLGKFQ